MKSTLGKAILTLAAGGLIALIPAPQGLDPSAWYFFAIFIAVIAGLILEPIPPAAVGFVGVFVVATLGLAGPKPGDSIRWALSGFSNTTVWLIFGAFMFALGYEKTGLGKRIGLFLVKKMGKQTLGLGYAITLADFILAPFTPSNTARSAGTIFPIVRNLPVLYGSLPGETARRIGSYIMWTAFSATCVTSSMFLTALAPNLLALELVHKTTNLSISWTEWLAGFLPVGLPLLLILPLLIYKIYPPEIRSSQEAPSWAGRELQNMGKITRQEWMMSLLAVLALALWIFGGNLLDATTVVGVIISLMLISRVISWDDVLGNKQAWNVLVWFATLVALADGLNKIGFVAWVASSSAERMSGMSPTVVLFLLVVVFFMLHYLFASLTAHTTAVLPLILAAGAAVPGLPLKPFALLLCYSLGIMGVLDPYATGPAPVYFGSGYISRRDFWTLGFVFGMVFLLSLLCIGAPYVLTFSG
jgi:L-tartrate/succinate antiporter